MKPGRPQRIVWGGGLLIVVIAGLAAYDIYRGYREAIANAGRELDAQARLIAEQTARTLQAVDVVLRHIAEQDRRGTFSRLSAEDLHKYLREQTIGLVQVEGVGIIDPAGRPRVVSIAHPPPPGTITNIARLESFQALKAGYRGLYIGDAIKAPDGTWVLPLGRRIEGGDGSFAGVAAARGRIEYFEQFYRNVQLDQATVINLMRDNGTLLARHPHAEDSLGKRLPLYDKISRATGIQREVSPIDGIERLGVLKLVPDYPLAVVVTRDVASALAPWRVQARGTALRTLALAILAAVLLVLVMRQFRRVTAAQERFSLAVAGSEYGIWEYDFVNRTVFASARAREISAMPPGPETQPMDDWMGATPIHPEDAPKRVAAMQDHLAGKAPAYEGEFRMMLPDGNYRWIRIHGVCVRDAAGKPLRMAGSTTDIDERKRAEEALRESQERYALAVAGSDAGVFDFDFINRRVFNSARARELAGL